MAKDYSDLSDAELDRRIAELTGGAGTPQGTSAGSVGRSILGGASSGATGLLGFIPEVLSIPLQASGRGAPTVPGTNVSLGGSPTQAMRQAFQVPEEPRSGVEQAMYRFAEGFTPAAAVASPSFMAGPVVGGIATVGSGLLGGFSNMAAKGIFPESPTMQTLVNLLPAGLAGVASRVRTNVPTTGKPAESPETGIPMTSGQRRGAEAALREEQAVSKTTEGAPVFETFKLTQTRSAEDFANKIQEFTANPNLSVTKINEGVVNAVNAENSRLVNSFRANNNANFNAVKKATGNDKLFETSNVNNTIDNLIAQYSSDKYPAEFRAVVDNLREVKGQFTTRGEPVTLLDATGNPIGVNVPRGPSKLTADELQKNLESWAKAASTGEFTIPGGTGNVFKGVAPGTIKGIARQVLNGFRSDLDSAVSANVTGAKELEKARTSYRQGLEQLDKYAEVPFVKYFMKDNPEALVPEEAVNALTTAKPSERVVMIRLLEERRPDLISSIRSRTMEDLMNRSTVDGIVDTNNLLGNLKEAVRQKREPGAIGLNDFLFPTPKEQAKATALITDLEKINKQPVGPVESMRSQIQGITTEGTAAATNWTIAKAVSTVQDTLNLVSGSANSSQKLAWMMTNPQGQSMLRYLADQKVTNKPLPQTYADTLNFMAKSFAAPAVTNRASDLPGQVPQGGLEGLSDEELDRRIKELQGQ
jgi:hypothetical protein